MSYKVTIENKYGDKLELTGNPNYITKITGLSPVTSNIITASVANYGGERFVSSKKQKRNIILKIYPQEPVEANRINLYKYIKSDDFIRVYYKNKSRDVYIDGYVESFDADLFEQTQLAYVSIICPQPSFMDVDTELKILSVNNARFYFPFYCIPEKKPILFSVYDDGAMLVTNYSDDDIGFIYKIQCNNTVIAPMLYLEETGEYFKLKGTYYKDSVITIDTRNGKKSVTLDLRGSVKNIINDVDTSSTWFNLRSGYNHLVQTASVGLNNMVSELIFTNEYEGV